jgi:hypothetical protein
LVYSSAIAQNNSTQSPALQSNSTVPSGSYTYSLEQIKKSPTQMENINPKVFELMQILAENENARDKNEVEMSISKLEAALNTSSLLPRREPIVMEAYTHVLDFHFNKNDYTNTKRVADEIIRLYETEQCYSCVALWHVYSKRGISRFLEGANNPNPNWNWQEPTSIAFWREAMADLRRARVIYGRVKSLYDTDYYDMVAWDLAINAYLNNFSHRTSELEKARIQNILTPSPSLRATYWRNSSACSAYGRTATAVNLADYPQFKDIKFGSAVGVYDLASDGLPANIKIVSILPGTELQSLAILTINNSRFPVSPINLPEDCKKERVAVIRFVNVPNSTH